MRTVPGHAHDAVWISSSEGIELNKAFVRIKDNKLRRLVISLVKAMAGEEEPVRL